MKMKKYLLSCLFFAVGTLVCATGAKAQEAPKVEVFGGYSYVRLNDHLGQDLDMNGWNASAAYNINKWLGVVADFGGAYKSPNGLDANLHTFLFGPQLSYRKHDRVTPFAHALFGVARYKNEVLVSETDGTLGKVKVTDTDFAMAVGGGFDVKITKHFSIRPIQADYLLTRNFGTNQSNFRYSGGAVFNF